MFLVISYSFCYVATILDFKMATTDYLTFVMSDLPYYLQTLYWVE